MFLLCGLQSSFSAVNQPTVSVPFSKMFLNIAAVMHMPWCEGYGQSKSKWKDKRATVGTRYRLGPLLIILFIIFLFCWTVFKILCRVLESNFIYTNSSVGTTAFCHRGLQIAELLFHSPYSLSCTKTQHLFQVQYQCFHLFMPERSFPYSPLSQDFLSIPEGKEICLFVGRVHGLAAIVVHRWWETGRLENSQNTNTAGTVSRNPAFH